LLHSAKQRAAERGVTLSALVEDALRQHISTGQPDSVPPFRLHTVRGRLVNPSIDLDRTSSLITAEDEIAFRGSQG
jgi:hypothetical protein